MSDWKLSHYSALFEGHDGEILLCNSFMGALARIPATSAGALAKAARDGLSNDDRDDLLRMLCEHGYFVPQDIDEISLVSNLLHRERSSSGQELIVMPHEDCNFRCVYCYEDFARGAMKPPIVAALKRLVAREIERWGRLHISWFGGEPLLAKRAVFDLSRSFMETCTHAGVRYSSAMTTNGYYLTPDVADELLACQVNFFQITLDGPEHTHNARRHLRKGGPSYAQVLANIVAMTRRDADFTIRLRVNFDPDSFDAVKGWFDEIGPLFAADDRIQLAFHPIGKWGGANDPNLHVCSEDSAWTSKLELFERSGDHGFNAATFRGFLAAHGSTCYAGREGSMVIGSDGRIYKCTVAFNDPRNQVGQLEHDGSLTIDRAKWNKWVATDGLDNKKCGSCWFNAACQSRACPLVAMETNIPPCPTREQEMRDIIEISAYGQRCGGHEKASENLTFSEA